MSSTELLVTPAERRWDFSRDAVTPGRLTAWGAELACASALIAPLADIPWEAGAGAGVLCTGAAVWYERAKGSWRRVTVARASSWLATTGWLSYTLAEGPTLLTMAFGGAIWATGAAVNIGMDRWGETTREAEKKLDQQLAQGEQIKAAQDGWAKLLYDVPHVVTAHSLEPRRPWKAEQLGGGYRLSSWAERTAYEAADAVVAVSRGMRTDVLDCYPSIDPARVHVISNGIDADFYRPDPSTHVLERLGVDLSRPYVTFVGRITRQKGVPHLLRAGLRLDPSVQLVLLAGAADTPS